MDLKVLKWDDGKWIYVAEEMNQWLSLVNMVMWEILN
jgi:hypothetical protein